MLKVLFGSSEAVHRVVVLPFVDEGGRVPGKLFKHPRKAPVAELHAAVRAQLGIEQPRLFIQATKQELLADSASLALLEAASQGGKQLVVVIATRDGAPLSQAAAALPPLQEVPFGPKQLPLVGNAMLAKGPTGVPQVNIMYNLWTNPAIERTWGETVCLSLPLDVFSKCEAGVEPDFDEQDVPIKAIFTSDPEVVAELIQREDEFPKMWTRGKQLDIKAVSGDGIFTCSTTSPNWSAAHGLLPKHTNALRVKSYFPLLLDKTRSFCREWSKFAPGAEIKEVPDWLACMAIDAMVKCLYGLDMRNVEKKSAGEPLHPFLNAFRDAVHIVTKKPADRRAELGAKGLVGANVELELMKQVKNANETIDLHVHDIIERTRTGEYGNRNCMVWSLLHEKSTTNGEFCHFHVIRDHIVNLLVAGHETTGSTLGFTFYYLNKHPECLQRCLEEIKSVLGDKPEPAAADLAKLVYTEACFLEALRLHPAVTLLTRDATADTLLAGRYLVRRGQRIAAAPLGLHLNPKHWGGKFGDVTAYNPERFLPEAVQARHPNAFVGFGFGLRACIGSQFALWEAKTFLSMVLPRFELKLPDGFKLYPSTKEGGLSPTCENLSLFIRPRENAPPIARGLSITELALATAAPAPGAAAAAAAAPGGGVPITLLYGSNAGTSEQLATQLAMSASACGFAAKPVPLDVHLAASGGKLAADGSLVIITATYNGNPPDNCVAFNKYLDNLAPGALEGLSVAVFGVGNSKWRTFQAFAKKVDNSLKSAGAQQLRAYAGADVDNASWTDAFEEWCSAVVADLKIKHKMSGEAVATPKQLRVVIEPLGSEQPSVMSALDPLNNDAAAVAESIRKLKQLVLSQGADAAKVDQQMNESGFAGYTHLEVTAARQLQSAASPTATRHVEFKLPAGMPYTAGDHLEVTAVNNPSLVKAALSVLDIKGDEMFVWKPSEGHARSPVGRLLAEVAPAGKRIDAALPVTAAVALSLLVDLSAKPTKRVVAEMAEACPCPPEKMQLQKLATQEGYAEGILATGLTLVELLDKYRSVPVDLSTLINWLPKLSARYYSISSSPLGCATTCSVTVGAVTYTTPTGRVHKGATSTLLHTREVGQRVLGRVRQLDSHFRLPRDPSVPVIMVGPGTGLAPMMGFLQERAVLQQQGKKLGPAHLFYGCRNASEDYIYQAELEGYLASGVLTGLHIAFSRQGPTKVYVQDLIGEHAVELWPLLEAGNVYICGDARRMAPDVRKAFTLIAEQCGGRTPEQADAWMGSMLEAHRYNEDCWAGGS